MGGPDRAQPGGDGATKVVLDPAHCLGGERRLRGGFGGTSLWRRDIADPSGEVDPARRAQQQQVQDMLQRCLARLPERNRLAIVSCIADDVRAELVAQTLNTTANAVYLLIARGKRQLKECLQSAGLSRDVLSIFETA